jgi:hypothetical protein
VHKNAVQTVSVRRSQGMEASEASPEATTHKITPEEAE